VDTKWTVKVADFGVSSKIMQESVEKSTKISQDSESSFTVLGSPAWTAPEVLRANTTHESEAVHTFSADVYSFGMVLYSLCSRVEPFKGMQSYHVVIGVASQGLRPAIPTYVPLPLAEIIETCWCEDPKSRPTFLQLIATLEALSFPKVSSQYPYIKKTKKKRKSYFETTQEEELQNEAEESNLYSSTSRITEEDEAEVPLMSSDTDLFDGTDTPKLYETLFGHKT